MKVGPILRSTILNFFSNLWKKEFCFFSVDPSEITMILKQLMSSIGVKFKVKKFTDP